MKRSNEINTSEISERIKAAANRLLGHHVGLVAIFEQGRLGISCLECGGRWTVVDAEGLDSRHGLDLILTIDGDGYCEEGATNYFDSNGMVTHRI
jgi:hypothetical protein